MKEFMWNKGSVYPGFWANRDNRRQYMQWLGKQLCFKSPGDWYKITGKDFLRNNGSGLLQYYKNSPLAAVTDCFPKYNWKQWLFGKTPQHFWKNPDNRYQYMQWLGVQLDFRTPEDWYRITAKDFKTNKGGGLLAEYYQSSPAEAVMEYLPEYDWKEWLFPSAPRNFWKNRDNRYRYMRWLETQLGFKTPEAWYRITERDFRKNKGLRFLKYYQDSPAAAVMDYLPGYEWKVWLFDNIPLNFWNKRDNRYQYMQWLSDQLGFKTPEDWYKITGKDFYSHKGGGLLFHYYQDSPSAAVMDYLPNYEWKEWLFTKTPQDFWKKTDNRRRYMQWLGEQLGFQAPEDWYNVTLENFRKYNGRGLLALSQDSPSVIVMEYLPHIAWKEWLFTTAPKNFWEKPANRRRYMQWLGERLGFKTPEDWYNITGKDFHSDHGGGFLAGQYQDSPVAAVMDYFPEYEWKEWLFVSHVPNGFWEKPVNRRRYMQWLGKQLCFEKPKDWYRVTHKDFCKNYGRALLQYCQHSPAIAVMDYLPDYCWQPENFSERQKRQKRLYRIIKRIFLPYETEWDFKHSDMKFERTGRRMELDIFISSLSLAIEYQGEQHVVPISIWGGISALKECQQRDREKRKACKKYEITLIEIPHTWDGREDTAIEMLSQQFIKKVKDKVKGTKQIQAALKALNTYCRNKQRKQRKESFVDEQVTFKFS